MAQSARVEDVRELSYRVMTKAEALADIGRVIGFKGHKRSQLSKHDLNSIHWYVTGGQVCPRIDFGTERSPPMFRLRKAVATECGFPYPDHGFTGEDDSRAFRRNELRAIVRKVRRSADQRDHSDYSKR